MSTVDFEKMDEVGEAVCLAVPFESDVAVLVPRPMKGSMNSAKMQLPLFRLIGKSRLHRWTQTVWYQVHCCMQ